MIYITGDTHGDFSRLYGIEFKENDILIILGDSGINYYLNKNDLRLKDELKKFKCKFFCIQGNHEQRPENISSYNETEMFEGKVYIEPDYPNLIFAKNGEIYNLNEKKVLVIGGAYSVDKDYRLLKGYQWFCDEQLTVDEQDDILQKYKGKAVDIILSHTCPLKYEPTETFLEYIDQSKVDKTMESFLDKIEEAVTYDKWYCGHYHIEKNIDKIEFMYGRIKEFNTDNFFPKYNRNGYEIVRDAFSQEVALKSDITCPVCASKDIMLQKGDGFKINGYDVIAVICNHCKKVYAFSDVKYKRDCPKEL